MAIAHAVISRKLSVKGYSSVYDCKVGFTVQPPMKICTVNAYYILS